MKKRILLFITLFITLINIYTLSFANEINSTDLAIYSSGAVLMDYQTGKILMQKDMNKKLYPASTTKILTAIIAIENLNLTDSLTASRSAVMAIPSGYSNAGIKAGEVLSVSDLLDMFLIHSANEIGYIFGEQISGSIEKFADLMNQKAIEIGCTNTHFTNPSGIHDINHYSTAYDMALIARYCMNNETFKNIVNKKNCKVSATELYPQERFYKNTNSLLDSSNKRYYYEYATGIKTGFTTQAKNCLIASASKDGLNLIAVMLGAEATENGLSGRYTDAKNLFNYGFENYEKKEFLQSNSIVKKLKIKNATKDTKELNLVAKSSLSTIFNINFDTSSLNPIIEINQNISAPISKDTILGKITYTIDGISYSSDLIASSDVIKSNILEILIQIVSAIILLIILSKILHHKYFINKKKKKKRHKKFEKNNSIYKFKFE
ncbi:MAG: hypothetical protein BHV99_02840 [Clostridium sp. 26_21]|nr:MAG: hypothetical protein BHV99_02840 [Clostridium sp. 26_21]